MAILPENKKKQPSINEMPDIFLFGASYVGKSTFADNAQDVLFINTDGNTDELLSPSITVANVVTVQGRMTTTKLAWEVFKEIVDELEKKQNDYKYIAIDLMEDLREHCRVYIYKKLGIMFRKRIYAIACMAGSATYYLIFTYFMKDSPTASLVATLCCIGVIFVIRMCATFFRWNMPVAIDFSKIKKD